MLPVPAPVAEPAVLRWLPTPASDALELRSLLCPSPEGVREAVEVTQYVNDARHEGPGCHAPPE